MLSTTQKDALRVAASEAVACEIKTKLPSELTVAQWALESAWGNTEPGWNCFGIKSYPGAYGRQLLWTEEWFTPAELHGFLALSDGRTASLYQPPETHGARERYRVKDWFASFTRLSECFEKHAELISTAHAYSKPWTQYLLDGDVTALIRGIATVYATSPTYASTLLSIVAMPEVQAALKTARQQ